MPGADAVSGAVALPLVLDVALEPAVELEPGLALEPEEQAATASAAVATTAMAGARSRFDLFIECLPFLWFPGGAPLRGGRASLAGSGRRIAGRGQGVGDVGRAP